MPDLFGRVDQALLGGLSSDSMFMSWPELTNFGLGLLIQNASLQYRQPIRRIFELGPGVVPLGGGGIQSAAPCDFGYNSICAYRTQATYYIIGRPEGRLQLTRFVGPAALACAFYRIYGSPCGGNLVRLTARTGCSAYDAASRIMGWALWGVVLDDYQAQASGQEMVMQEGIGAMFTSLNVFISGDPVCPY